MTPRQIALVRSSFAAASRQRNRLAGIFFAQIFVRDSGLRTVFRGDLRAQGLGLYEGLLQIVESLDRLYPIVPALEWLAVQAARRGVGERHYAAIGEALVAALETGLGDDFGPEHRSAWGAACARVSRIMVEALEPQPLAA